MLFLRGINFGLKNQYEALPRLERERLRLKQNLCLFGSIRLNYLRLLNKRDGEADLLRLRAALFVERELVNRGKLASPRREKLTLERPFLFRGFVTSRRACHARLSRIAWRAGYGLPSHGCRLRSRARNKRKQCRQSGRELERSAFHNGS